MKRLIVAALLIVLAGTVVASTRSIAAPTEAPRITIDELRASLGDPALVVVDVRSTHDWENATMKIRGAIREDPARLGTWINRYSKAKKIVLY